MPERPPVSPGEEFGLLSADRLAETNLECPEANRTNHQIRACGSPNDHGDLHDRGGLRLIATQGASR
jgi:hypothetical protein